MPRNPGPGWAHGRVQANSRPRGQRNKIERRPGDGVTPVTRDGHRLHRPVQGRRAQSYETVCTGTSLRGMDQARSEGVPALPAGGRLSRRTCRRPAIGARACELLAADGAGGHLPRRFSVGDGDVELTVMLRLRRPAARLGGALWLLETGESAPPGRGLLALAGREKRRRWADAKRCAVTSRASPWRQPSPLQCCRRSEVGEPAVPTVSAWSRLRSTHVRTEAATPRPAG